MLVFVFFQVIILIAVKYLLFFYNLQRTTVHIYSMWHLYLLLFVAAAAPLYRQLFFNAAVAALLLLLRLLQLLLRLLLLLLLLLLLILGRTIVCNAVLPSLRLELVTAPLALANQQLSLQGRTCLTRPSQDSKAASLSLVQMLIRSSNEDLLQTGRIHPDCQSPATEADYNLHSLFKGTV